MKKLKYVLLSLLLLLSVSNLKAEEIKTFNFLDINNNIITSQKLKDGDKLYEPEVAKTIDNKKFIGWYDGEEKFTSFNEELKINDYKTVNLKAKYEDAIYLFYHDQNGYVVKAVEVEKNSNVEITPNYPIIETNKLTTKHMGWKLAGSDEDISGTFMVGDKSLNLYPIVKEGYWVTYDTNGGSLISNEYIPIDSISKLAPKPSDPIKTGYKFTNWYEDSSLTKEFDFTKEINKSLTLYAKWEPAEVNYLVRYYYEYQKDINNDTWDYKLAIEEKKTGLTGSLASYDAAYIYNNINIDRYGYELDEELSDSDIIIQSDGSTIINVYYRAKEFSIKFKYKLNDDTEKVIYKEKVKFSKDLKYLWDEIEADGVLNDNNAFASETDSSKFYIGYNSRTSKASYNESWVLRSINGTYYGINIFTETLEKEEVDDVKYFNNKSLRASGTYQELNQGSFIEHTGEPDTRTYTLLKSKGAFMNSKPEYTEFVISPNSYEGFILRMDISDGHYFRYADNHSDPYFRGHYGIKCGFSSSYHNIYSPQGGYKIYAGKDNLVNVYYIRLKYKISFNNTNEDVLEDIMDIPYEKPLSTYKPENYVEGVTKYVDETGRVFVFAGWYIDNDYKNKFDFDSIMPAFDLNLFAKWEPEKLKVTFNENGGTEVEDIDEISYGEQVKEPEISREGYIFLGWSFNGKPYNFSSAIKEDLILNAEWRSIDAYKVKYDLNGGSGNINDDNLYYEGNNILVRDFKNIKAPKNKVFLGWENSFDNNLYYPNSLSYMAIDGVTLKAKWGEIVPPNTSASKSNNSIYLIITLISILGTSTYLYKKRI